MLSPTRFILPLAAPWASPACTLTLLHTWVRMERRVMWRAPMVVFIRCCFPLPTTLATPPPTAPRRAPSTASPRRTCRSILPRATAHRACWTTTITMRWPSNATWQRASTLTPSPVPWVRPPVCTPTRSSTRPAPMTRTWELSLWVVSTRSPTPAATATTPSPTAAWTVITKTSTAT